jgi:pilus assembly protein CpaB
VKRLLVIVLALALALAGAALVLFYVDRADERAIADQQPTDVWIAVEDVPAGTTLRDAERQELVEQTQVPAKAVPSGALEDVTADNRSLLALSDITAGEVLLENRFGDTPTGDRAIAVPPGRLAVAVELSDPARVGEFVTPGSHISIYRTAELVALEDGPRADTVNDNDFKETSVLIGDALVIGMGDTALAGGSAAGDEDEEGGSGRSQPSFLVTVALTPDQALRVVHQAMNGEMYAALRGSDVDVDPQGSVDDLDWPGGLP